MLAGARRERVAADSDLVGPLGCDVEVVRCEMRQPKDHKIQELQEVTGDVRT